MGSPPLSGKPSSLSIAVIVTEALYPETVVSFVDCGPTISPAALRSPGVPAPSIMSEKVPWIGPCNRFFNEVVDWPLAVEIQETR